MAIATKSRLAAGHPYGQPTTLDPILAIVQRHGLKVIVTSCKPVLAKLRTNSLIKGSAVYLVSNILNAAIPFALLPVLTRYLSPAEYGEVAMFMTFTAALTAFTGLNTVGAANREYFDHGENGSELPYFISSCLQILLLSGALVLLLSWLFQAQLSAWLGLDRHWVLWAVLVSSSGFLIQLRLGQWLVRKRARAYGLFQVGQSLTNMLLSLLLVVMLEQGASGRLTGYTVAVLFFAALAIALLTRDGLLGITWRPRYLISALTFGIPLIPHVGGIFLLSAVDRFVINAELGLAQTGIYNVAAQFAAVLSIICNAINKAYVPWLYERLKNDRTNEKKQIVRFTYGYFSAALAMAGCFFIFGPAMVAFIAGPSYAEAGSVIGWIALGHGFSGMYLMVTNFVFYSRRTGLLSLSTLFSGLLNVGLMVFLIGLFGLVGAGIAFAVAMATRFLLTWWIAQRRHPMPWFQLRHAEN